MNTEIRSSIRMIYQNEDSIYEVNEGSFYRNGIDPKNMFQVLKSLLVNMGYDPDTIYKELQYDFMLWIASQDEL